ncbi:sigma-70 family RNA polymerase sigma factor [Arundinibacter roseus]|uniref:Sigma-70 family RNA polymerase sigma factor n=2 Tax=Arundinibacter roseus TaxID=2070510 RepID=A0A4R4K5M9_9BACT|nr:sigma-70 family RNA polymerase sigma factor [Arundinibacter roseus]
MYREYWHPLYIFALAKTHDKDIAEELIQDLFVQLWEKRNELNISHLRGYLFACARNRIIDYYKDSIFLELEKATDSIAPDYPLFLEELETQIQETLGSLSPKTREIFLLNRFEGQSAREIAIQLELPVRTVEYHITQGLRLFRLSFQSLLTSFLLLLSL